MSIDLGFCWCFPNESPETGLSRLRDCGFDGIELWPDALKQHGTDQWRSALTATGMRCLQLCPYFDFVHGPERIEQSRRMLDEYINSAKVLNCSRLRVFTGPPWGEGVVGAREASPRQWDDAINHLREFCDIAALSDIELCLECHEGSLMEDSPSTLRLLNGVNRNNLTTNLQLPLLNEPWQTSVEQLAPYTTHIHIHNWTGAIGVGDITFLDAGTFDWLAAIREILARSQRGLCLSVEHANHGGKDDPWQTATRDGAYLQQLRKQLF